MATKTINISSWEANTRINTNTEANIESGAAFVDTYHIIFGTASPESVEVYCETSGLNQLDGKLQLFNIGCSGFTGYEIINADALPKPIPTPLNAASDSFSNFLWIFTGYELKIFIDKGTATEGIIKLSLGIRNE